MLSNYLRVKGTTHWKQKCIQCRTMGSRITHVCNKLDRPNVDSVGIQRPIELV